MPYRFVTENTDYSDYSSGRVFYAAPGHPAFPVRLISELFQRCQAIRHEDGAKGQAVIYDPCCGSGYHLSALAYLHWPDIQTIIASDIDAKILVTAEQNVSLLTQTGLDHRKRKIEKMHAEFQKESHLAALGSIQHFKQIVKNNRLIQTDIFQADGLNRDEVVQKINGRPIDIVLADVPYGGLSNWQTAEPDDEPLTRLLEVLLAVVSPQSVIAIVTNKGQKCNHPRYKRVDRFQIGKRRIFLLKADI